jgi:hypothetical protein
MSKLTLGVLAGVAIAAAVASVPALGSAHADIALSSGGPATSTTAPAHSVRSATTARVTPRRTTARRTTATRTTSKVTKVVRTVTLSVPADAKVGANVTGFIQVADVAGTTSTPVAGVAVALQQKRGTAFVTIEDGVTDGTGRFAVSFTSRANTTWRAELVPATGRPVYGAAVLTTSSAQVTWATRPDLDVTHGVAVQYGFRVSPAIGAVGQLQIQNTAKPGKWLSAKATAVPATGVLLQKVTFPTAGTWLVRGASVATGTNSAGYTTELTVVVH